LAFVLACLYGLQDFGSHPFYEVVARLQLTTAWSGFGFGVIAVYLYRWFWR
jgi:hypothetical protein